MSPIAPSALDKPSPHAYRYVPFFFFLFTDLPLTAHRSSVPSSATHTPPSYLAATNYPFRPISSPPSSCQHIYGHTQRVFPCPFRLLTPPSITTRACRRPQAGSHAASSPCPSIVFYSSSLSPAVAFPLRPPPSRFGTSSARTPVFCTRSTPLPADVLIIRHRSSCLIPPVRAI